MSEKRKVADPLLSKLQESLSHVPEHSGTCPKKNSQNNYFSWGEESWIPSVGMAQRNGAKANRTKNRR